MNLNAPLIISSPVRRSGTTLIQRLLCSSSNGLIYGENCAHELSMLINILMTRKLQFQFGLQERDRLLQQVLDGDTDEWIADLMPEMPGYIQQLEPSYLSVMDYYQHFANKHQRPIWGMKMAEWAAQSLIHTLLTLPQSKLIYIIRPLEGCARSAKTIGQIQRLEDLRFFCETWLHNQQAIIQRIPPAQKMLIDYDQLIETPTAVIPQLEAFTGIADIQLKVLEKRINTFTNDKQGDPSGQGYLSPGDMNTEELALIARYEEQNKTWQDHYAANTL